MSSAYSSRFSLTKRSRSAGSSISWIWLKNTALIAASGPITAICACGKARHAVGLEGRAGHRVEPGAVGLADDHRDLRHRRLGDRADHLRPVPDDPLPLDVLADHEAGHVRQEEQRDVEGVAGHDEPRRLVGGVDEQDAALHLRLVGHDPDRPAVEPRVADDHLLRPARVHLEERVGIDDRPDQVLDVEGVLLVRRDDLARPPGSRPVRRAAPPAGPPASWRACTRGSGGRGRSRPRRTR